MGPGHTWTFREGNKEGRTVSQMTVERGEGMRQSVTPMAQKLELR